MSKGKNLGESHMNSAIGKYVQKMRCQKVLSRAIQHKKIDQIFLKLNFQL